MNRTVRKNKRRMFYSLYDSMQQVYATDENGNIIYETVDGVSVPVERGVKRAVYKKPVEFSANISSTLHRTRFQAWGIDNSSNYAELCCDKGALPLEVGSLIWRTSAIKWDVQGVNPRQSSCDYVVKDTMTEGLFQDLYLLQKNTSDSKE